MELFGRHDELAVVETALTSDRPILVVGEAGIGKTAVIRAAVAASGRGLWQGGGFATLSWMPFLALERAVRRPLRGDAEWVAAAVERAVGPDVLFVDDLQWVDDGTLEAVGRLIGRVALVCALRAGDAGAAAVLEHIGGAELTIVELGPLDPDAAAALLRSRRPAISAVQANRLAARAGGNPLLIEELAAAGAPSVSLRRAVEARLGHLTLGARRALGLLALADRPLPTGVPEDEAAVLVRDGLATREADGLTVRHALLREAVDASLDDEVRRELHALLGGLLTEPGERARHLAAAGRRDEAHALALQAVACASTPGERAAHLGVAAATATGPEADDLRVEAAAALRVAGDLDGATTLLDAVGAADPERVAHAEAVRARVCWSAGDPNGMRRAIERGLAAAGGHGSPAEAMLRAEAVVLTALVDGRFEEGLSDAEAAVGLARRAGVDPTRALLLRATILTGLGRAGWIEALESVVAAARATGDSETELSAANNLVTGHEMHGNPADGRALAVAMIERSRELRLAGWERQFGALLAGLDLHAGNLAAALERADALLEEALDPLAAQQVGLTAALALVDLGRHEEAAARLEPLLATAADDVAGRGDVLWVLAEAALWGGRPLDALRRVDEYRAYEGSEYPNSHLVDVTAAWAASEAGRPIPTPIARTEPVGMTSGARFERQAVERLVAGDPAGAASAFDVAAAAWAGFHRRGELRSRWAAAEARRLAGDVDAARSALSALELEATTDGFRPQVGRIHRSLRLLGVRRATRGPAIDGAARMTAREREVADLVAHGLSNIEIARRLGVGRPTVARLLGSAMAKLGVDSRAQVASVAAR